jgi:hypothetical protein
MCCESMMSSRLKSRLSPDQFRRESPAILVEATIGRQYSGIATT